MTEEPIMSFLVCVAFLYGPNTYAGKDDQHGKRVVPMHGSFPFTLSLLVSKPQIVSVDKMCIKSKEITPGELKIL